MQHVFQEVGDVLDVVFSTFCVLCFITFLTERCILSSVCLFVFPFNVLEICCVYLLCYKHPLCYIFLDMLCFYVLFCVSFRLLFSILCLCYVSITCWWHFSSTMFRIFGILYGKSYFIRFALYRHLGWCVMFHGHIWAQGRPSGPSDLQR